MLWVMIHSGLIPEQDDILSDLKLVQLSLILDLRI